MALREDYPEPATAAVVRTLPARQRAIDWWWVVSTLPITAYYGFFAVAHFQEWLTTGRPAGAAFFVYETFVFALFVLRRRPLVTTTSAAVWVTACVGAFGPLLLRPGDDPLLGLGPVWSTMEAAGIVGSAVSLGFLGRSFGIVAANRGVRDRGPYAIVRHPAYACYLVASVAYVLESPTAWNLAVVGLSTAFQLLRIRDEEALLALDPEYEAYRERVRYRLLPGIF